MPAADDEEERQVDSDDNEALSSVPSDSENEMSDDEEEPAPAIEWLATGRERRSTAGNRMKSMIAAEEPDDELELLFAEDGDDAGFTDAGDDGSDGQMSSSEDEDAQENGDELAGEQELEKQARESKQAARKRKAQEAIPLKFRKKVKIDTSQTPGASTTRTPPQPRPKKKSERLSWLPSPADMPTRASKRETTMAGKEQLHRQMVEREYKRLKQLEAMERKAKKMEALKKPPMTQAERLAEAALVEKRNAKSLNRWEEAEKQREEERRAKLAALNNRTLEGPVVTFWSGVGEWVDGKLKHVGKIVTIEDKPAKKKRHSAVGHGGTVESAKAGQVDARSSPGTTAPSSKETDSKSERDQESVPKAENAAGVEQVAHPASSKAGEMALASGPISPTVRLAPAVEASSHHHIPTPDNDSRPRSPAAAGMRPPDLKAPDLRPPGSGLYTTSSVFALSTPQSLMKPPELKPHSVLAPPVGVSRNGLSMPMIGYHSSPSSMSTSNVLAPPNPAQGQSPLSMPHRDTHPPLPPVMTPIQSAQVMSNPAPTASSSSSNTLAIKPLKTPLITVKHSKANAQKNPPKEAIAPPQPSAPANGRATRNCIILQNFNENAIKDKSVQTRILFGREMSKLSKHGPATRCVITNHPARYRDPKTGLPYYNAYAFKEIQKLYKGEYKWSSLVGAWVGTGTCAASGVPARFLDPNAPGPVKELTHIDLPPNNDDSTADATEMVGPHEPAVGTEALHAPKSSQIAAPVEANQSSSSGSTAPAVTSRPDEGPETSDIPSIARESSNITESYLPTTQATFVLNMDM
ncbi:YL1-domain-containing protein [Xylaria sp. CBS 124048]|nr:YL1-domain-containing protein [Xylaria sp. CBS 124048]